MTFDDDDIRALAHKLWEKAGRPLGLTDDFWHQAKKILKDRELWREARKELWSAGRVIGGVLVVVSTLFAHNLCDAYAAQFGIDTTGLSVSGFADFIWLCAKGIWALSYWFIILGAMPLFSSWIFSGRRSLGHTGDDLRPLIAFLLLGQGLCVASLTYFIVNRTITGALYAYLDFGSSVPFAVLFYWIRRRKLIRTSLTCLASEHHDQLLRESRDAWTLSALQCLLWIIPALLWADATNPQTRDGTIAIVIVSALSGFALMICDQVPWRPLLVKSAFLAMAMFAFCSLPQIQLFVANSIFQKSGLGRIPGVEFSVRAPLAAILKKKGFAVEATSASDSPELRRILDAYLVAKGKDVYYFLPSQPTTVSSLLEKAPDSIIEVRRDETFLLSTSNPLANYHAKLYDLIIAFPEAEGESIHQGLALDPETVDTSDARWAHLWPTRKYIAISFGDEKRKWRTVFEKRIDVQASLAAIDKIRSETDDRRLKLMRDFYAHYLGIDIEKLKNIAASDDSQKALLSGSFNFDTVRPTPATGNSPSAYPEVYVSWISSALEDEGLQEK